MSCNVHRTMMNPCPVCRGEKIIAKAEDPEVKQHWEFWQSVIGEQVGKSTTRAGFANMPPALLAQLKLELSDFSQLMSSASEVYGDLTGGRISKPMTLPSAVIGEANSHKDDIQRDYVKEWLVSLDGEIPGWCLAMVRKSAQEHFNIPDEE